ncbi:MAG: DNA topoisomerase 4 subunit A [Bifidobacteriaceae bacterium]|jgi:DNA gyrase subunit A|nr:DNA topoisomerase 4 subunit A [Bifidobacteriaceae bacterium]
MVKKAESSGEQQFESAEKITDIDINDEMSSSFLEYAYSVIYSRALPDARDGLKPVQRRIIYQMSQMGLTPDKAFVKSARVVGDVMGKLHPHGDAAIYDAMVRLAQDFSLTVPLVMGHGNFGSLHDSPAAPRYTEAKLSKYSLLMCENIDEDTVDFIPNYDNKLKEPEVLPASFPNLLVNGASGIAVGMATNIPSHNLQEVLNACIYLINNPAAEIKDLQKIILGPDFPTGAVIVNKKELKGIYETGRGLLKVRAKPEIEINGRVKSIVFTELPYLVDPERVIAKIKDSINSGKIIGISSVDDFTDRKRGMRLQIDIKSGYDEKTVLAMLYKYTPLEDTFGVNMVALVDGHPQTLNLKQMLAVWIRHRIAVLRRRSEHRLKMAQNRMHLVDGLLVAINSIDRVIQIVRNSETQNEALQLLKSEFSLDDLQGNYILDLRLRRLTKFSKLELETEKSELEKTISELKEILNSDSKFNELLIGEINKVIAENPVDRKTAFAKSSDNLLNVGDEEIADIQRAKRRKNAEIEIAAKKGKAAYVCRTFRGYAGVLSPEILGEDFSLNQINESLKKDAISQIIKTTTTSNLFTLLSDGSATGISVSTLPVLDKLSDLENSDASKKLDSILELPLGLSPLAFWKSQDELESENETLAAATSQGTVIRVRPFKAPQKDENFQMVNLKENDYLIDAALCNDESTFAFITRDAQLLTFSAKKVRPQGKGSGGVAGISLKDGDSVLAFSALENKDQACILTIAGDNALLPGTQNGFAKVSPLSIYPPKGRGSQGVRCQRFLKGQNALIYASISAGEPIAFTSRGKKVELPKSTDKRDASGEAIDYPIQAPN